MYTEHSAFRDFFALELYDGRLYARMNLGGGAESVGVVSRTNLNDGQWHRVAVSRQATNPPALVIAVDGQSKVVVMPAGSQHLDLTTKVFLGGVPAATLNVAAVEDLITQEPFLGCLRLLRIDGVTINVRTPLTQSNMQVRLFKKERRKERRNEKRMRKGGRTQKTGTKGAWGRKRVQINAP